MCVEPGRKIYGVTLPTENEISDIEVSKLIACLVWSID